MAENEKSLPFGMARKLDLICDRFEAEFQGGKQPRIEDNLTDVAGEERDALLKSLLQIELELLRRAGQKPDLATYHTRFPGFPAVIDSVFTEHELRTEQVADLSRTRIGPTPSAATGRKETISFGRASADTSTDLQQPRKDGTALNKGDTLGRFEILKVLGEGGFGRVYHANDPQLDREVALKVPHVAALGSPEMLERFMQEARSAANLLHANICPVHEIGEFDGQPYIVMAFIDGKPLSAFINPDKPLSERQVCLIVRKVTLAIEAAHRSGVIHRDLKPDNIMIDRSRREPVVMDFGLARRETRGETQLTQVGQIMGTPTYMPPEQAKGDIENIGPHSDVYSLGVILYELLTGERPFTGSIAEVLASILKDEPPPPSTHRPDLSPELEAICLKAMSKETSGRFSSMAEFGHALGDFLKQAGTAGPNPVSRPGRTRGQKEKEDQAGLTVFFETPRLGKAFDRYLSRKNAGLWSSRSPLTRVLIGTAALVLLALLSVILFRTKHGMVQLEILDPSINVTFAGETITVDNDGKLIDITPGQHHLLVSYQGLEIPVEKPFEVKRGETTALRVTRIGNEVHVLKPGDPVPDSGPPPVAVASTELLHTLASDAAHVWDIAFSPDGRMIAAANDGSSVKIWNADTGELVHTLSEFESPVFCVAWSPDAKLLATGDSHRSTSGRQKSGTAAIWNTSDWKKTMTVTDTKAVRSLAFTPDGSRLIGGLGSTIPEDSLSRMEESYARRSSKSGSGRSVPSSMSFKMWQWGGMMMFDLAAEKAMETPSIDSSRIVGIAVSHDGKSFATCGYRGEFKLRDLKDGKPIVDLVEPPGSQYAVHAVAFAPDRDILAGGAPNGFIIYDAQHKRELVRNTTAGEVYALSFSDDGRILATGHQGQPIQLWNATSGELLTTLEVDWKKTTAIEFQPGGHRLAASGESRGDVRIWNLDLSPSPADQSVPAEPSKTSGSTTPSQPASEPTSEPPADTSSMPAELPTLKQRVETATGKPSSDPAVVALREELSDLRLKHYGTPWAITAAELMSKLRWPIDDFSRDQINPYELAVAGNGDPEHAPSGLVAVIGDSRLKHAGTVEFVSFSPNGKLLASASQDNTVRIWDTETGRQLHKLDGYPDDARCVVFSPDGNMLATCSGWASSKLPETFEIRLWDIAAAKFKPNLKGHTAAVRRVAFSPDGTGLASASYDGTIRIWDLKSGSSDVLTGHMGPVLDVAFHPIDLKTLVSSGSDKTVRIWDVKTHKERRPPLSEHTAVVPCVQFSSDGTTLATCGGEKDNSIRLWNAKDWSLIRQFKGHSSSVSSVSFQPKQQLFATSSNDASIRYWNISTGVEMTDLRVLPVQDRRNVYSVCFSPDGSLLASGGTDGAVKIWKEGTSELKHTFDGHITRFASKSGNRAYGPICMSLDGSTLASTGENGGVITWDVSTARRRKTLFERSNLIPRSIALSPDGRLLARTVHWRSSPVLFYDTRTGKYATSPVGKYYADLVQFSPNGKLFAVATHKPDDIRIYTSAQQELGKLDRASKSVHMMGFSADSRMFLVADLGSGDVRAWDTSTLKQIGGPMRAGSGTVSQFCFSADGSTMATGKWISAEARTWDFSKSPPLAGPDFTTPEIRRENAHTRAVAISADGRSLFTRQNGNIIRQWNIPDRKLVATFATDYTNASIYEFFLTPEGRHLIAANTNGTFFVIRLADASHESTEMPMRAATQSPAASTVPAAGAASAAATPAPMATTSSASPAEKPVSAADEKQPRFEIIWMKNLTGLNWEFEPGQNEEELVKQLALKKRTGMIPVSISGYADQNGQPRLCSLWTAGHSPVIARFNKTRDELQGVYQNRPSGFYLTWRDFYRIGEETRTAFVFVATGNTGGLHTKSNFNRDGFQKELDEYRERKYRPTMMSGFVSGSGAIRYYGQWRNDRLPYDYKLDISREECETQISELQKLGHQLIWLDAYTKASKRYYSYVTVKPAVATVWEASLAVPASQLEELMKKQRNRRFFPSVINVE